MFRIKFPTKRIFRIFPILRTDGMAPLGTYLWNDPRNSAGKSVKKDIENKHRSTTNK